jgi:Na+/H+-dicarboxylate symporter
MAGVHGNLMILGVILPIYTIIDMIETAENVWSDCCICAVVDKELDA